MKDFFSNDQIYNAVINLRLSLLGKRKKMHSDREISFHPSTHFFHKISYKGESILEKILPPRRAWSEAGFDRRNEVLLNFQTRIRFALFTTYKKALLEKENPNWLSEFQKFCEIVRNKVANISDAGFDSPTLFAIEKKRQPTKVEYRPIVQYSLIDRVIIGLSAKYFVNLLDSEFYENSFAFRKPRGKIPVTHNTAFEKIMEYKRANLGKDIFVAECDIKKFYDCINHKIVVEKLSLLTGRLEAKGISFDTNAAAVLRKYLESFSFYNNIYKPCDNTWFSEKGLSEFGLFDWEHDGLKKEFEYGFDPTSTSFFPVGIPQGGALSCVISNIVLDYVDREVTLDSDKEIIDKDLLYLRYCDDMIILHTDKAKCAEALTRYKNAIKECKLLVHETSDLFYEQEYTKAFWDKKSKPIYKWGQPTKKEKNSVPWLSFVGYQLRYDFQIRARNNSVVKHVCTDSIMYHYSG